MNEWNKRGVWLMSLCLSTLTGCGVADGPTASDDTTDSDETTLPSGSDNSTSSTTVNQTTTHGGTSPSNSNTTSTDDALESSASANSSEEPGLTSVSDATTSAGATDTLTSTPETSASSTNDATSTSNGATSGMTTQEIEPLDCGPDGWAVENHGPPENRVNYIILGDGYDATTINTTLEEHVHKALERRFEHESGEPYGRYRKFVNICVMKVVSESNGIGNGPTAFDGGNGGDRLARVNSQKVRTYLNENLPERIEPSWTAVVLNQDLWENTGSVLMLWSGANDEAPGAALHEGGHGFHGLADEYGSCTGRGCGEDTNGSGTMGQEFQEVNSTGNPATTDGKWDLWFGDVQKAMKDPNGTATGLQSSFSGSRYLSPADGQYRPSDNSMMNSLFGLNPDTSFNSVSREQMVFSIWQFVRPVDSTVPEAGEVSGPGTLQVNVIDPEVISVDWSVDGEVVAENAGTTFDTSVLTAGEHIVAAHAYDNATEDLVRLRTSECPRSVSGSYCHATAWKNSQQTVEWTVTIP